MKRVWLALVLGALSVLAFAQNDEGAVVEGPSWAFLAASPTGWVRDAKSLKHQGIEALFYKEGRQFSTSDLYLYISPFPKQRESAENLAAFIEKDRTWFIDSSSNLSVKVLPDYDPGLGYSFPLREMDDPANGYYQEVAYYEGKEAYFIFVLSCRSPEQRQAEKPALFQLLSSFTYLDQQ